MPKIGIEWYSPGCVTIDEDDRLICVSPSGLPLYWKAGLELSSLDVLAYVASTKPSSPDEVLKLPGEWEPLPSSPPVRKLLLTAQDTWGVGVHGNIEFRPQRNLSLRGGWTTVPTPGAEMLCLQRPGTPATSAVCPAISLTDYLNLGSARIQALHTLKQAALDAEEGVYPTTFVNGSDSAQARSQREEQSQGASAQSQPSSTDPTTTVAASQFTGSDSQGQEPAAALRPLDSESADAAKRGSHPLTTTAAPPGATLQPQQSQQAGMAKAQADAAESESLGGRETPSFDGTASSAAEESFAVENLYGAQGQKAAVEALSWIVTDLSGQVMDLLVNNDGCYILCIDSAQQLWGRLGIKPQRPFGTYWIR